MKLSFNFQGIKLVAVSLALLIVGQSATFAKVGIGTVENWAYMLNYATDSNVSKANAETALINFINGKCEPTQPKGASLKIKRGPLSHITLDPHDLPKSLFDRINKETKAKALCYVSVGTYELYRAENLFLVNRKTGDISVLRQPKNSFETAVLDLFKNGQIGGKMTTECREERGNETFDVMIINGKKMCFWPGEYWIKPVGKDKKISETLLRNYFNEQLNLAKSRGCTAVELYNLDGSEYSDQKGKQVMSLSENIYFVNVLNDVCGKHSTMACGYKNSLGIANPKSQKGPDVTNFSFVVQEECHSSTNGSPTNCKEFVDFFKNLPILNIEYPDKTLFPYTHPRLFTNFRESQSMNEMTSSVIKSCLK